MVDFEKVSLLAKTYSQQHGYDVLLCSGPMGRQLDEDIHKRLAEKHHQNLLLLLATSGGDLHVAYRMARHLQRSYKHIRVCVAGWCKSAGTLLTVCGNELIMSDRGELGPVDVQIERTDDLWESTSGLTESAALSTLEEVSWSLFRKLVIETKGLPGGNITFKTAAEAAAPLVSEMLKPIFEQIDPLKLGENARRLNIATAYLNRVDAHSSNLATRSDVLVSAYPDHGFVIDRKEAERLFKNVLEPSPDLLNLCYELGDVLSHPSSNRTTLIFVDRLPPKEEGEPDDEEGKPDDNRAEVGPNTDGSISADGVSNDGGVSSDGKSRASPAAVESS